MSTVLAKGLRRVNNLFMLIEANFKNKDLKQAGEKNV